MNQVKKAAEGATYKTFWCAGPSIEYVTEIQPMKKILQDFFKK
jgi:nitronate monooxygenase